MFILLLNNFVLSARKEIISMEGKESGEMFHTRTEQTNETISCVTERKATTSLNTGHVSLL